MNLKKNKVTIREINKNEAKIIVDYFHNSSIDYLRGMGIDPDKLPEKNKWFDTISNEISKDFRQKSLYYLVWLLDNNPIGHSNINAIKYGQEAYMHLHIWDKDLRQNGLGMEFMKLTIKNYFENFKLKKLYCQPYSLNPSPNRILKKLGFEFVGEFEYVPSNFHFFQKVNRWMFLVENL